MHANQKKKMPQTGTLRPDKLFRPTGLVMRPVTSEWTPAAELTKMQMGMGKPGSLSHLFLKTR